MDLDFSKLHKITTKYIITAIKLDLATTIHKVENLNTYRAQECKLEAYTLYVGFDAPNLLASSLRYTKMNQAHQKEMIGDKGPSIMTLVDGGWINEENLEIRAIS